ncbi:MAG: 23S rRNA (pseudouridine(1915)-N(3))-methyltransferase RlmH [bacterium]
MANKVRIIVVGKAHDKLFLAAISEYEKRINPYLKIQWLIIPPKTEATIVQTVTSESNYILANLKEAEYVFLLDEHGTQMTSTEFSASLTSALSVSKDVAFVIGGAYGVSETLKNRANKIVSFGKMVMPHQLMRLVLAEQLYRSISIQNGTGYHHD